MIQNTRQVERIGSPDSSIHIPESWQTLERKAVKNFLSLYEIKKEEELPAPLLADWPRVKNGGYCFQNWVCFMFQHQTTNTEDPTPKQISSFVESITHCAMLSLGMRRPLDALELLTALNNAHGQGVSNTGWLYHHAPKLILSDADFLRIKRLGSSIAECLIYSDFFHRCDLGKTSAPQFFSQDGVSYPFNSGSACQFLSRFGGLEHLHLLKSFHHNARECCAEGATGAAIFRINVRSLLELAQPVLDRYLSLPSHPIHFTNYLGEAFAHFLGLGNFCLRSKNLSALDCGMCDPLALLYKEAPSIENGRFRVNTGWYRDNFSEVANACAALDRLVKADFLALVSTEPQDFSIQVTLRPQGREFVRELLSHLKSIKIEHLK